ncbi:MAG: acyl carrier protein [Oscillospiraceae bacterium]|nr:acyl carrier protein [Oscillospiraceae bacterium]MBQ4538578.1 acyl carrier protein [Oscillospiraceae bacterium]
MIFDKVKSIIAEQLDIDEDSITLESAIIDDLGADSLDIVDLVMSFEDEFDTEISDEAIEEMKTVGDIVHYIEENLA